MDRDDSLRTLGLDPTAEWPDIIAAYQALAAQYREERFSEDEAARAYALKQLDLLETAIGVLEKERERRSVQFEGDGSQETEPPAEGAAWPPAALPESSVELPEGIVPIVAPVVRGKREKGLPLIVPALLVIAVAMAFLFMIAVTLSARVERTSSSLEQVAAYEPEEEHYLIKEYIPDQSPPPFEAPPESPFSPEEPNTDANLQEEPALSEQSDPVDSLLHNVMTGGTEDESLAPEGYEVGVNFKPKDKIYVLSGATNAEEKYKGYTPDLIDAAIGCDVPRLRSLIDDGGDVNLADDSGETALAWAVKGKCAPAVKLLIQRGAQVNRPSRNGFTPYIWARLYRSEEIQRILLAAGANPSAGRYWWRFDEDAEREWINRALESACKNKDCRAEALKKTPSKR